MELNPEAFTGEQSREWVSAFGFIPRSAANCVVGH